MQNVFEQRLAEKLGPVLNSGLFNAQPGPVRVLEWRGPVATKPVRDPNTGELLPWWSVWEHGLAAEGIASAWKVTGDPRWRDALEVVATTVINYGTFPDPNNGGALTLAADVAWIDGGLELPEAERRVGSSMISFGGIGPFWMLPAVLAGIEVLPDGPTRDRAYAISERYYAAEPTRQDLAEWYAQVPERPQAVA